MSYGQPPWIAITLLGPDLATEAVAVISETHTYGSTAGPFSGIGGAAITDFQMTGIRMRAGGMLIFADTRPLGWVPAEAVTEFINGPWPDVHQRRTPGLQPVEQSPYPITTARPDPFPGQDIPSAGDPSREPASDEPGRRVTRMLDLSTAHLPAELGTGGLAQIPGVIAHRTAYGFLMWVPEDPAATGEATFAVVPDEVATIWAYARALGCDYVLFDCDADTVDDLPIWDW